MSHFPVLHVVFNFWLESNRDFFLCLLSVSVYTTWVGWKSGQFEHLFHIHLKVTFFFFPPPSRDRLPLVEQLHVISEAKLDGLAVGQLMKKITSALNYLTENNEHTSTPSDGY